MVGILVFTVSSQIIGTFAVLNKDIDALLFFSFLFLWLIVLFFMRVVDDYIDSEHDWEHYRDRSLQKGEVSFQKLVASSIMLLGIISLYFTILFWSSTLIFICIAIWNTLLSIFSFGFDKSFRFDHIIAYHILNSIGISSIQILLYFLLDADWSSSRVLFLHFLLVFFNNFLLEVTRKLKSKDEVSHHDDYISILGKNINSLLIFFLFLAIFIVNMMIYSMQSDHGGVAFFLYSLFFLGWLYCLWRYHFHASKRNKKILLGYSLIFYLYSNTLFLFI